MESKSSFGRSSACNDELAAEVGEEPKEERNHGAEEKASDDGEVKGCVFAAVHDVAGQAAEAEGKLGAKIENDPDENEKTA